VGARQQWSSLTRRRLLICFEEPIYRRLHIAPHLVQALLPLIPSCSLNAPPAPIVLRQCSVSALSMLLWCSFTTPLKLDNPDLQEIHDACADLGRGEEEEEDDDEKDSHEDDSEDEEAAERLALGKKAGLTGTDPEPSRCGRNDNWTLKRENKIHKAKQERQSLLDQSFSGMDGGERKQAGEKEFKGKTLIDFGEIV